MDPVTHAASGAVALLALPKRPATLWALPLAAIACASPDIDLAFIHTPLEFLFLHRGITHSLAAAPFLALPLALLCWPMWRKKTPDAWKFSQVWLFCIAMLMLHMWLDVVTTYGTMIFLPFSHYRVRLNSLYIIDPLVTLPLLWAIWRWRPRRGLILLALGWIFFYPAMGIGLNQWHLAQNEARLAQQGRGITDAHMLPDAFAPFFWRFIFQEDGMDGPTVRNQGINALGQARTGENVYPAVPPALLRKLESQSLDGNAFFNFAMLPVMEELRPQDIPDQNVDGDNASFFMFYDLRFGSDIQFVRELLDKRPDADLPFLFMVEMLADPAFDEDGKNDKNVLADQEIGRVRLRFSDSGRDSLWHKPYPLEQPDFWHWLVGLP